MIPSQRWFPSSLQDRAAWFQNFSNKFAEIAASLGFAQTDIDNVQNDNATMQFVASIDEQIKTYDEAARQYRKIITEGNIGAPVPQFPANLVITMPTVSVATGIFERLDRLVERIRVAPAFTQETGALLGINPHNGGAPTPPDEMKPLLKVVSMPSSIVELSFVRGKTDGVLVQLQLDKEENWTEAGRFFRSPISLSIPPNGNNLPRAVRLRARFLQGNNAIGQYSDIVETVTQS